MNNKKASNGGSTTTPLYKTVGPDGKEVIFTATDLVSGMGKIKSKSGVKFKPTKYKGESMSDIISSDSFGKVKK